MKRRGEANRHWRRSLAGHIGSLGIDTQSTLAERTGRRLSASRVRWVAISERMAERTGVRFCCRGGLYGRPEAGALGGSLR